MPIPHLESSHVIQHPIFILGAQNYWLCSQSVAMRHAKRRRDAIKTSRSDLFEKFDHK